MWMCSFSCSCIEETFIDHLLFANVPDGGETKIIKLSPWPCEAHILGRGLIWHASLDDCGLSSDRSKPRLWWEHRQSAWCSLRNKEASWTKWPQAELWGGHSKCHHIKILGQSLGNSIPWNFNPSFTNLGWEVANRDVDRIQCPACMFGPCNIGLLEFWLFSC